MDHCAAKKSPDAVPPFGGLTRVVEGMKYPPGIYFGREGNRLECTYRDNLHRRAIRFDHSAHARIVRDNVTVTDLLGPVWFVPATTPSAPSKSETTSVLNGARVRPGRIYLQSEVRVDSIIGLKDENGNFSAVMMRSGDFHDVDVPSTVHYNGLDLVTWEPFE